MRDSRCGSNRYIGPQIFGSPGQNPEIPAHFCNSGALLGYSLASRAILGFDTSDIKRDATKVREIFFIILLSQPSRMSAMTKAPSSWPITLDILAAEALARFARSLRLRRAGLARLLLFTIITYAIVRSGTAADDICVGVRFAMVALVTPPAISVVAIHDSAPRAVISDNQILGPIAVINDSRCRIRHACRCTQKRQCHCYALQNLAHFKFPSSLTGL